MSLNVYKIVCVVVCMVLDGCSVYKSYIDRSTSLSINPKSILQQTTKTKAKTKIAKTKTRELVINYFNQQLQNSTKYGVTLPKGYVKLLKNWQLPTLKVGEYLFFGFLTPNSGDEQKVARSLIRKQNSDQSCYLLDVSVPVKVKKRRKGKPATTRLYFIKQPFCIAALIDGSCGYYIDLVEESIGNKYSSRIYKCHEDGKTEICANSIDAFLKICRLAEKRKPPISFGSVR
ncbi:MULTISPECIES: hypothetical protein [Candidatus Cardinium]|uniref:hypothetical protein n=1 Tax=Candidatus Cardinium TaxID=273135 RepID=UPI001FAA2604|nr:MULTISPECIES: hypothetical protein [Cardinium]